MAQNSSIINILSYRLPFELANQLFNEFQSRLKEAKYLITTYKTYRVLEDNMSTVEIILALSIFKKRVVSNFSGAAIFYRKVNEYSGAEEIKIGSFILDENQKNRLLGVVLSYNDILQKFSIPIEIMNYTETTTLLKAIIRLKKSLEYAENQKGAG